MKNSQLKRLAQLDHVRVTRENLDDLLNAPEWTRMQQDLVDSLDESIDKLLAPNNNIETYSFLRGRISVLREILGFPDNLEGEVEGNKHMNPPTEETLQEENKFYERRDELGDENNG